MSESAARIGRRIRELREAMGLTQAELAGRLDRTQTSLSYWEAGKRAPGLDDLFDLAAVFETTPSDLLPSPRRSLRAALRAVYANVDTDNLAEELEKFADEAETMDPPPMKHSVLNSTPREAAEALLAMASVSRAPVEVERLAMDCGVRVLFWDFSDIDGLVVELDEGAVIGVNKNHHSNRQRFTIAHELGHYLLRHKNSFHVDFSGELSTMSAGEHPGFDWRAERAANNFAANLLMPASLVRDAYRRLGDTAKTAAEFEVSTAAMGFRLRNLGIV